MGKQLTQDSKHNPKEKDDRHYSTSRLTVELQLPRPGQLKEVLASEAEAPTHKQQLTCNEKKDLEAQTGGQSRKH